MSDALESLAHIKLVIPSNLFTALIRPILLMMNLQEVYFMGRQSVVLMICQVLVEKMVSQLADGLDTNQLLVRVIPFETDDLTERYKEVKRVVDEFIYEVAPNYPGMGRQVLEIWQKELFQNATQKNIELTISKKQLVWTIIVLTTDVEKNESEYLEEVDSCDYHEIVRTYKNLINTCTERFEFATKIISDYNAYEYQGRTKDKLYDFINNQWENYLDEFEDNQIDEEIKEQIIKIILFNVLKQKWTVNSIVLLLQK